MGRNARLAKAFRTMASRRCSGVICTYSGRLMPSMRACTAVWDPTASMALRAVSLRSWVRARSWAAPEAPTLPAPGRTAATEADRAVWATSPPVAAKVEAAAGAAKASGAGTPAAVKPMAPATWGTVRPASCRPWNTGPVESSWVVARRVLPTSAANISPVQLMSWPALVRARSGKRATVSAAASAKSATLAAVRARLPVLRLDSCCFRASKTLAKVGSWRNWGCRSPTYKVNSSSGTSLNRGSRSRTYWRTRLLTSGWLSRS